MALDFVNLPPEIRNDPAFAEFLAANTEGVFAPDFSFSSFDPPGFQFDPIGLGAPEFGGGGNLFVDTNANAVVDGAGNQVMSLEDFDEVAELGTGFRMGEPGALDKISKWFDDHPRTTNAAAAILTTLGLGGIGLAIGSAFSGGDQKFTLPEPTPPTPAVAAAREALNRALTSPSAASPLSLGGRSLANRFYGPSATGAEDLDATFRFGLAGQRNFSDLLLGQTARELGYDAAESPQMAAIRARALSEIPEFLGPVPGRRSIVPMARGADGVWGSADMDGAGQVFSPGDSGNFDEKTGLPRPTPGGGNAWDVDENGNLVNRGGGVLDRTIAAPRGAGNGRGPGVLPDSWPNADGTMMLRPPDMSDQDWARRIGWFPGPQGQGWVPGETIPGAGEQSTLTTPPDGTTDPINAAGRVPGGPLSALYDASGRLARLPEGLAGLLPAEILESDTTPEYQAFTAQTGLNPALRATRELYTRTTGRGAGQGDPRNAAGAAPQYGPLPGSPERSVASYYDATGRLAELPPGVLGMLGSEEVAGPITEEYAAWVNQVLPGASTANRRLRELYTRTTGRGAGQGDPRNAAGTTPQYGPLPAPQNRSVGSYYDAAGRLAEIPAGLRGNLALSGADDPNVTPEFRAWLGKEFPGVPTSTPEARELYTRSMGRGAGQGDPRNAAGAAPVYGPTPGESAFGIDAVTLPGGPGEPGFGIDAAMLPGGPGEAPFSIDALTLPGGNRPGPASSPGGTMLRPLSGPVPTTEDLLQQSLRRTLTSTTPRPPVAGAGQLQQFLRRTLADTTPRPLPGTQLDPARLIDPVADELTQQVLNVSRGEISNPALVRQFAEEESQLTNSLFQQLGPQWGVSSAGIEAMQKLRESQALRKEEDRRAVLASLAPQQQQRRQFNVTFPEERYLGREGLRQRSLGLLLPAELARQQFGEERYQGREGLRQRSLSLLLPADLERQQFGELKRQRGLGERIGLGTLGRTSTPTLSTSLSNLVPISPLLGLDGADADRRLQDNLRTNLALDAFRSNRASDASNAQSIANLFTTAAGFGLGGRRASTALF